MCSFAALFLTNKARDRIGEAQPVRPGLKS